MSTQDPQPNVVTTEDPATPPVETPPSTEDALRGILGDPGKADSVPKETTPPADPAPDEGKTDPKPEDNPAETPKEDENNSVIKQMREAQKATKAEADKAKAVLQKIADQKGVSIEELEEQLQAEEDKKVATQKGIDPTIQKTLREQEARIKELETERMRTDFIIRADKLSQQFQLNSEAMEDFASKAADKGINIFAPGVDLVTVYRALNYENIVKADQARIRQEILAEIQQTKNTSPGVGKPGTPAPAVGTPQDMISTIFSRLAPKK